MCGINFTANLCQGCGDRVKRAFFTCLFVPGLRFC